MPLYEYKCTNCSSVFEVIQKIAERPLHKCTLCGGSLKKLVSSPAIQFKGTGWYITDYARKGQSTPTTQNKPKVKKTKSKKESSEPKKNHPSTPAH